MDKKKAESWDDGHKIEELAGAYLDFREQMWKVLADVLGEKWDIVEKKVSFLLLTGIPEVERLILTFCFSVWKRESKH